MRKRKRRRGKRGRREGVRKRKKERKKTKITHYHGIQLPLLWGTYLHQVVNSGKKLRVSRQSAVHLVSRLRNKSLSKFPLEHQHSTPAMEKKTQLKVSLVPQLRFLIACSMQKLSQKAWWIFWFSFCILQAIKNRSWGRPGNEAS